METLTPQRKSGTLPDMMANIEVLELLRNRIEAREEEEREFNSNNKRKKKKQTPKRANRHRDWIEEQVLQYLQTTPCTQFETPRLPELVDRLQKSPAKGGFGLTEAEALQVVNMAPAEAVDIHLLVDDLPSRLNDRQQEELLEFVATFLKKDTEGTEQMETEEGTDPNADAAPDEMEAVVKDPMDAEHV